MSEIGTYDLSDILGHRITLGFKDLRIFFQLFFLGKISNKNFKYIYFSTTL
jgi:hypothetical protein